mgnify:FL=1
MPVAALSLPTRVCRLCTVIENIRCEVTNCLEGFSDPEVGALAFSYIKSVNLLLKLLHRLDEGCLISNTI